MAVRTTHFIRAMRGAIVIALVWSAIGIANADVTIAGTRIVYPAQQNQVAVKLANAGVNPALVQLWIDDGDPKQTPDESAAPFLMSPPVARIEPGKGQIVRLVYSAELDQSPPSDREALYWLNMLEIPPGVDSADAAENHLQIAFRTRIKVFLRPPGLLGSADSAARDLRWRVLEGQDGWSLECSNPSAYHVSFSRIGLRLDGKSYEFDQAGMIAPGARLLLKLDRADSTPIAPASVEYSVINDYGGVADFSGTAIP